MVDLLVVHAKGVAPMFREILPKDRPRRALAVLAVHVFAADGSLRPLSRYLAWVSKVATVLSLCTRALPQDLHGR